ncbi:MAG: GNAT family N-acetyltransferase [Bryobacteraceae bacterium]|nr:GNAT family N-acetyltransferase [Bryobacteraceae bacterium]
MNEKFRIEPLSNDPDRSGFACGSGILDRYLREQASQDVKRRVSACYIAVSVSGGETAGFYTLAAASVALADLPVSIARKLPRYPVVPAALVGRLAVAQRYQGRGLGGVLLTDAIVRVARADLGIFSVLVDAKDRAAQRFYEHHGFMLLPEPGRRLCLPIGLALRQLTSGRLV